MFSGDIENDQWHEMGHWLQTDKVLNVLFSISLDNFGLAFTYRGWVIIRLCSAVIS